MSELGGSRVLTTEFAGVVRAWLVFTTTESRLPLVLGLGDRAFTDDPTRVEAHMALNGQGRDLLTRIETLSPEQLTALAQQEDDGHGAVALVERILRYWSRARLGSVDWLRFGPDGTTIVVPKFLQDEELDLTSGAPVMLAGDGFADVHGTVTSDEGDTWMVEPHWHVWDRET